MGNVSFPSVLLARFQCGFALRLKRQFEIDLSLEGIHFGDLNFDTIAKFEDSASAPAG
jgi:hypothetical protein